MKARRAPSREDEAKTPAAEPGPQSDATDYSNAFAAEQLQAAAHGDGNTTAGGSESETPAPAQAAGGLPVTLSMSVNPHIQTQTADLSNYPNFFGISEYSVRLPQVTISRSESGYDMAVNLDVMTPWNTQNRGRINIESAQSSEINTRNWASVARDLQPRGIGRPDRDRYWSESISQRHEQYHGRDDYGWTSSNAPGLAQTAIAGMTIPEDHTQDDVRPLVLASLRAITRGNDAHYGAHERGDGDAAGEHRAYGDGRAEYQQLYEDIVQRARDEFHLETLRSLSASSAKPWPPTDGVTNAG